MKQNKEQNEGTEYFYNYIMIKLELAFAMISKGVMFNVNCLWKT